MSLMNNRKRHVTPNNTEIKKRKIEHPGYYLHFKHPRCRSQFMLRFFYYFYHLLSKTLEQAMVTHLNAKTLSLK